MSVTLPSPDRCRHFHLQRQRPSVKKHLFLLHFNSVGARPFFFFFFFRLGTAAFIYPAEDKDRLPLKKKKRATNHVRLYLLEEKVPLSADMYKNGSI